MINLINGLGGENDCLAWDEDNVLLVFEMECIESWEGILVWYAYMMKWSVCKRTLRSNRGR